MEKRPILDHGYLGYVEHWGSDERIIEAARMSTDGGFISWDPYDGHPRGDQGLLSYLYKNKHSTPFEMAGLVIEVQAPIFIFRQWHRHRTQSYNEMSARYTPLPDVNYRPTIERCIVVPAGNKQARGSTSRTPTHEEVLDWLENYLDPAYLAAQRAYDYGLKIGIPKEIARLSVNVARYSRMRASANLRNWLGFLTLRMDPHAQEEIRAFANAIGDLIAEHYPRTWKLFLEGNEWDSFATR